jgi:hypothetical protein
MSEKEHHMNKSRINWKVAAVSGALVGVGIGGFAIAGADDPIVLPDGVVLDRSLSVSSPGQAPTTTIASPARVDVTSTTIASPDSPASVASPPSPDSPASVASPPSPDSPASVASPPSPDSPASVASPPPGQPPHPRPRQPGQRRLAPEPGLPGQRGVGGQSRIELTPTNDRSPGRSARAPSRSW